VYCSISGFGQDGPLAARATFDSVIQALSGMMSINGSPGSPTKVGVPISDLSAGLYSAIGVLGALVERATTGRGRWVDVSMLESTMGLLGHVNGQYLMTGHSPAPVGSSHHSIVPYDVYPASDGHLVIAIVTEAFWPRLCRALGCDDLASDTRYATNAARVERREEVDALVTACLVRHPVAYWSERFGAEDVPFAPILSVGEALRQPQAVARSVVRRVEHDSLGATELQGPVIHFPGAAPSALRPPPRLGADTLDVLRELCGYQAEELDELLDSGAIVQAVHVGTRDMSAPA
jgi:crotonobetainyl-CoA:carnitine CoA-transferase CaiB-like acyl-CoA transferase